jgi:two-component system response regulator MprA
MPGERILVVDDDERLAASLRRSLEYAGYQVGVAHDGPRALTMAGQDRPDLVVLDVLLPELDGHGVCRALRASAAEGGGAGGAGPMVLMLTARDAVSDRVAGLDAGADDYLVKPFEHDELLARVRALLRRRPAPAQAAVPVPLTLADLTLDPGTREVRRGERQFELTALEFDLLHQFLRHPRQVLTRAQLLDAVWGGASPLTSNVVDVYVGYLRTKLEAAGEPRLLHTVRGVGYALRA